MSLQEAALRYHSLGYSVFPCLDKRSPLIYWGGHDNVMPSREQVRKWWTEWPNAWIGVALGRVSGIIRIDAEGPIPWAKYPMILTFEFKTPSGGGGWVYPWFSGVETDVVWRGANKHEELRIQADGAYAILPPSPGYTLIHSVMSNQIPDWVTDNAAKCAIKHLEKQMRPFISEPNRAEALEALERIDPDCDYDTWIRVLFALQSMGQEYLQTAIDWSARGTKYKQGEVEGKWSRFVVTKGVTGKSIVWIAEKHYGYVRKDRYEPITDAGNSRMFARANDGKVKHSGDLGWMVWDGRRWSLRDADKDVLELQLTAIRERLKAASQSLTKHNENGDRDSKDFAEIQKLKNKTVMAIRRHEDGYHIPNSLNFASANPLMRIDARDLDQHPYLLNCLNGTLDLKTGVIKDHDPDDLITQLCPHRYDPAAKCPRYMKFLQEVFNGDEQIIEFMHKLDGLSLTGDVTEHILPILIGSGRNGKSTWVKIKQYVMGDDYSDITPQHFLEHSPNNQRHATEIADLRCKRFVADVETPEGMPLNAARIKRLTGGDDLKGRHLYKNFTKFPQTHKIFIATNHEPSLKVVDLAMEARLLFIKFLVSFYGREEKNLYETLQGEAEGILAYYVQGFKNWKGLSPIPLSVRGSTADYFERQGAGNVDVFFNECIILDPTSSGEEKHSVRMKYERWCGTNHHTAVSPIAFGKKLFARGVIDDRNGKKYGGIRLA